VEDICTITVTPSRISTGLIAIPKEHSPMFPQVETEIHVWYDDKHEPVLRRFVPHTSRTKETRIYGMSEWYRTYQVRADDRLTIERLSEREGLYLLKVERELRRGEDTLADADLVLVSCDILEPPPRVRAEVLRIVRDTAKAKRLKTLYDHRCQLCGIRLPISNNTYCIEVHHLRPLGAEHSGVDDFGNMLVLCPNHHALFDYRVPRFLSPDVVELWGERITITCKHLIDAAVTGYHNRLHDGFFATKNLPPLKSAKADCVPL
jgi:hypothetical protein